MIIALTVLSGNWMSRATEGEYIAGYSPRATGQITFARDIAPIVFQNCSGCHRPDQSSPFNLLSYADVKRRARQIADVVGRRYMPPWPPDPVSLKFKDERRLAIDQIGQIQQWYHEGAALGNPADMPPDPVTNNQWELGPPDLMLGLPESYTLSAEGRDLYRNFVIPMTNTADRYVRAVEFLPRSRAVHHATMMIDTAHLSRELDAQEPGPGWSGMSFPETVISPQGHLLSWQPGRRAYRSGAGFAWTLPKGSDFVLQLHLNPTGRPEEVNPEVGLYFTREAPTNSFFKIVLTSTKIDIPAGQTNYVVEDYFKLPVDVSLYGVNCHAHFLCRRMEGYATLPDGTRKELILIKSWDFFWQYDYRLVTPLVLPRGTTLAMRYTYDNSTANPQNPSQPPRRVRYGPQSSDEMGELWLQVLAAPRDLPKLTADFAAKYETNTIDSLKCQLAINPADFAAHLQLALLEWKQGETNDAISHCEAANRLRPDIDEGHYYLGRIRLEQRQFEDARAELQKTVALNPNNYGAYEALAIVARFEGKRDEMVRYFREVLRIKPENEWAKKGLQSVGAGQ